jgi:PAS domain S-box-containing protein
MQQNEHLINRNAEGEQSNENDNHLFRLLLEFKDYSVIYVDTEGRITSWNLGAEHIYGYHQNEVLGKSVSVLYNAEELKEESIAHYLQSAIKDGRYEEEGWKYRKDGTAFYANTILTALYYECRSLKGFAHVTRDITLHKKLEEENRRLQEHQEEKIKQRTRELEVVNNELEAFSYSVSHDLRTPLRAISGYSMILKEDYGTKLDEEANRLIDTIVSNTRMMGDLIDDLLTFSKMARLETINEAIDMNSLVWRCIYELGVNKEKYTISVHSLPACNGDPGMLKQVWMNLLGNAIKYTSKKEAPQIEVGAIADGSFHIYYIKDNGAGFDMKYAGKLFGVFQRLHRQDEFEGTGLGLALAKRIISKHGGEIRVEALPEMGATFYFSIPKTNNE